MFPKTFKKTKSNRQKTGQKELFEEIWWEREHKYEKCWVYLYEAKAHNFAHIKPKWLYPELKFDKLNVKILCFSCHFQETTSLVYKWIDLW